MTYIKKKSQKQESRTAKEFGGKEQIASGALWGAKADVRTGSERTGSFNEGDFLIENKFTDKNFYSLKKKIWEKVQQEAIADNFRTPLMQIDIDDLELVVIDLNDYKGFNLAENMSVVVDEKSTFKKSYRINISDFDKLREEADEYGATPVLIINMEVGKPLRVVVMEKEDFLYVWDKTGI